MVQHFHLLYKIVMEPPLNTFVLLQFITLEGLNSGVPTRTTPTLTPTTLRNIEQTFIELQSKPESHENEAGFVPPLVHSIGKS